MTGDPRKLRPRLLLIFAVGIFGPVLLLSYLGWKDIESQQRLLSKLLEDRRREAARRGAAQVSSSFEALGKRIFASLSQRSGVENGTDPLRDEPLASDVFVLDLEDRQVLWPPATVRFLEPTELESELERRNRSDRFTEMLAVLAEDDDGGESFRKAVEVFEDYRSYRQQVVRLEEARRLLYRPGELPEVIARLKSLSREVADPELLAEIYLGLGQAWSRAAVATDPLKDPSGFLESQLRLRLADVALCKVEALGLELRIDRLLLFPVARQLRADLWRRLGEPKTGADLLLDFLEVLVLGELRLTRAEFESTLSRQLRTLDRMLPDAGPEAGELQARRERVEQRAAQAVKVADRRAELRRRLVSEIEARGALPPSGQLGWMVRRAWSDDELPEIVCYGLWPDQPGWVFGFDLDLGALVSDVAAPRLTAVAGDEEVALGVFDRGGAPWLMSSPGEQDRFSGGPRFEVQAPLSFLEVRAGRAEALREQLMANRRLWVTLALIGLSIGTVTVGAVIGWRSLRRSLELARLKQDFVSNVTHELRTPLTSIRMFGEMLQLGRVRSEKKQQEYFEIIAQESERLSKLIDNVLRFARMEAGKKPFNLERGSPRPTVEKAGEMVGSHLGRIGFDFELDIRDPLAEVFHDEEALLGALLNLISNARKYSGDGSEIELEAETVGDHVEIRVKDRGIGVSPEDKKRIFEKFYRGRGDKLEGVGGSGLGLALVSHVVAAHEGRIEVSDRPGGGSIFTVRLPKAEHIREPSRSSKRMKRYSPED